MGERRLGETRHPGELGPRPSARHQRALIELGYEGVTVEQVLEQRLRRARLGPAGHRRHRARRPSRTRCCSCGSRRLTDELGARAVELLAAERTVDDAPEVLRRIRRLLAHYRATEPALPAWCEAFVTAGYAHYCTLLPTAFVDEETGVRQVAAMLGFLFSMESLALSLGCDRTQLELAVAPVAPGGAGQGGAAVGGPAPARRAAPGRAARALRRPARPTRWCVPAFPQYLSGFVQALEPVPALAPFVVEVDVEGVRRGCPTRCCCPGCRR